MQDITFLVILGGVLLINLVVVVGVVLAPHLAKRWDVYKNQYPADAAFLEREISNAVKAAAQTVEDNAERLAFSITYVKEQAERYGYTFDEKTVKAMIEAKWFETKNALPKAK